MDRRGARAAAVLEDLLTFSPLTEVANNQRFRKKQQQSHPPGSLSGEDEIPTRLVE